MAQRLRVAAVGEVGEDLYEGVGARLGGISANFARSAAAAGAVAALFAAVGDDERGARVRAWLDDADLHEVRVRTLPGETALQKIQVPPSGERVFAGYDPGVLSGYQLAADERAALASWDVLALVCAPETQAVFDDALRIEGPRRVADFSVDSAAGDDPAAWVEPYAPRLRVAFVGGRAEHAEALRALSERVTTTIVLTAGAAGAWAFERGRALHQPAIATRIVDTTGCGDAFAAAFTVTRFEGAATGEALRAGAERAAVIAARIGA